MNAGSRYGLDPGILQHPEDAGTLDKHTADTVRPTGLELASIDQALDRAEADAKQLGGLFTRIDRVCFDWFSFDWHTYPSYNFL